MANVKISALPASAGLVAADLIAVVDDPSGTPVTQKATMTQVLALVAGTANNFTANQTITSAEPRFLFNESDAAANTKLWDFDIQGGIFRIRSRNDADDSGGVGLRMDRNVSALSFVSVGIQSAARVDISASQGIQFFASGGSQNFRVVDSGGRALFLGGVCDQSKSVQTPTTGFSITIGDSVGTLILTPAGTLATGTITMPATPLDGQVVRVSSQQIQTALTVSPNAGQSILNPPTALAAGIGFGYIYHLATTTWLRLY